MSLILITEFNAVEAQEEKLYSDNSCILHYL